MKHASWGTQRHSSLHEQRSGSYDSSSACQGGDITLSLDRSSADAKIASTATAGKALVAGEVGAALEVAQHERDSCRFKSSTTVADALLEEGAASSELGDLGLDEAALLFEAAVS